MGMVCVSQGSAVAEQARGAIGLENKDLFLAAHLDTPQLLVASGGHITAQSLNVNVSENFLYNCIPI